MQAGVGVLVCEAFRERSEQRAHKYPAAACAVAAQAQLLQRNDRAASSAPTLARMAGSYGPGLRCVCRRFTAAACGLRADME